MIRVDLVGGVTAQPDSNQPVQRSSAAPPRKTTTGRRGLCRTVKDRLGVKGHHVVGPLVGSVPGDQLYIA